MAKDWDVHVHPHSRGNPHQNSPNGDPVPHYKKVRLGNSIAQAAGNEQIRFRLLGNPDKAVNDLYPPNTGAGETRVTRPDITALLFPAAGGVTGADISAGLLTRIRSLQNGDPPENYGLMCSCGG